MKYNLEIIPVTPTDPDLPPTKTTLRFVPGLEVELGAVMHGLVRDVAPATASGVVNTKQTTILEVTHSRYMTSEHVANRAQHVAEALGHIVTR